jgi:hypothetical protein
LTAVGRGRAQRSQSTRPRPRWRQPVGWEKYKRLLRLVKKLDGYHSTADVLRAAGLAKDPRGGVGALHMASVLGLCHARSGGRRTLVWGPGQRPARETAPGLARETEYRRVVAVLRKAPRAAFPTAFLAELAGGRTRQEVVGAMKLLVAAGLVDHVIMRPWTKSHGITCWGGPHLTFATPTATTEVASGPRSRFRLSTRCCRPATS